MTNTPTQAEVDALKETLVALMAGGWSKECEAAQRAWSKAKVACDEAARLQIQFAGRELVNGFQRGQRV
jgi:anti-sigma regulatory factor (Ser/Thr protein kinase)